jgi:hypothetical protein
MPTVDLAHRPVVAPAHVDDPVVLVDDDPVADEAVLRPSKPTTQLPLTSVRMVSDRIQDI